MRALWQRATDDERRQLVKELVDDVTVQPDHLQVKIHGTPRLNVALQEVGLRGEIAGVGGASCTLTPRTLVGEFAATA